MSSGFTSAAPKRTKTTSAQSSRSLAQSHCAAVRAMSPFFSCTNAFLLILVAACVAFQHTSQSERSTIQGPYGLWTTSTFTSRRFASDESSYESSLEDSSDEPPSGEVPEESTPLEMVQSAPSPPEPKAKRLDPLMASLTRIDPNAPEVPTTNVPLLGEIPLDGSLVVLAPAAIIAVVGLITSVIIGFQSQDSIVDALNQVSQEVTQSAAERANMMYDENACRGICSSQEQNLEGLRGFMENFRRD